MLRGAARANEGSSRAAPQTHRASDERRGSAASALADLSSDAQLARPARYGANGVPSSCAAADPPAHASPGQVAAERRGAQRSLMLHIIEHTVHRIDHVQSTPSVSARMPDVSTALASIPPTWLTRSPPAPRGELTRPTHPYHGRLPRQVDLRRSAPADVEVLRADGAAATDRHAEMVVSNLRLFALSVALFDAEGERVLALPGDRELVTRAELIYENGLPVSSGAGAAARRCQRAMRHTCLRVCVC